MHSFPLSLDTETSEQTVFERKSTTVHERPDSRSSRMTRSSPIAALPYEILSTILSMVIKLWAEGDRPFAATMLSLVSRAWLETVKTLQPCLVVERISPAAVFPTFFKLLAVERIFSFTGALQRHDYQFANVEDASVVAGDDAQERMFPVEFHPVQYNHSSAHNSVSLYALMIHTLSTKKHLLRSLQLRVHLLPFYGWEKLVQGAFPELHVLQIWPLSFPPAPPTHRQLPTVFEIDTPNLRVLCMSSGVPSIITHGLFHLQRVVLHRISRADWSVDQFLTFLHKISRVQTLVFDGDFFILPDSKLASRSLSLPFLRNIRLSWPEIDPTHGRALNVLDYIDAPFVDSLWWGANAAFSMLTPLENPHIRYLRGVRVVISGSTSQGACAQFGSLQVLSTPEWTQLPVLPLVDTFIYHTTEYGQGIEGFLMKFPTVRRVFVVSACCRSEDAMMCIPDEIQSGEGGVPVWYWTVHPSEHFSLFV